MKKIPLTQGKFALVDDADYDYLSQYKWSAAKGVNTHYAQSRTKDGSRPKTLIMHRAILNITDTNIHVDHADGNGLNNQRHNIRPATRAQNQMNRSRGTGISKYKGVAYLKRGNRWVAQLRINKETHYLGCFKTEAGAAEAYNDAAKIHFGEFANLNVI